jgi:hypothetical protein
MTALVSDEIKSRLSATLRAMEQANGQKILRHVADMLTSHLSVANDGAAIGFPVWNQRIKNHAESMHG